MPSEAGEHDAPHQKSLKERFKASVVSYGVRQVAVLALALGSNVVLTRFLAPAQFGMVAVIAIVTSVAALLADGGLGVYLVQRHAEVTDQDLFRVTTLQTYAALLLAFLCFAGAALGSAFFPRQQLGWMVAAASLSLPLLVVRGMALLRLERSLRIDRVVRVELLEEGVYALTAIGFAAHGAGAWSVVVAQLCKAVVGSAAAAYLGSFRFRRVPLAWDDDLSRGFRFGFHYQSAQLINLARMAIVPLYVIPVLGLQAGGFVERSWFFCGAPLSILLAVQQRTMFPYVSRIQLDVEKVRRFAEDSVHASAVIDKLMFLPLAIYAREIILTVFGARWLPALPLVYWLLAGNVVFGALPGTLYAVANGLGRSDLMSRFNLYTLVASWALIVALTQAFGVVGVGMAGLVLWAGAYWLRMKIFAEVGRFRFFRQILMPLLAFGVTWGCTELLMRATGGRPASLGSLAGWAALAVVVYGAVIFALDGKRIRELWTGLREAEGVR